MLQVVERPLQEAASLVSRYAGELELGKGQVLEEEMAHDVQLPIFKLEMPDEWLTTHRCEAMLDPIIDNLALEVQSWFSAPTCEKLGPQPCRDPTLCREPSDCHNMRCRQPCRDPTPCRQPML